MHEQADIRDSNLLRDQDFRAIADIVYRHAGISLGEKKKNLVVSRLRKRLHQLGIGTFAEYVNHLNSRRTNPGEMTELINAITTNTTHFFREPHHFEFLEHFLQKWIFSPEAARRKKFRIWCAASSTGQEPYSIAITLSRIFSGRTDWDVKLLASDIDTNALSAASKGEYNRNEMETVSDADRHRYFNVSQATGQFKIKPGIRKLVVFRKINLIYDALEFHEPIDVIFCRNVMIYFSSENRSNLLAKLHRALANDGLLILGHSESIQLTDRNFTYVDTTIYRKRSVL